MDKIYFPSLERELVYQRFMIYYLQEEQKKRREELNEIKQNLVKFKNDLEKLRNNPRFKELQKNPKFKELLDLAADISTE
jgi:hypothetical protein